MGSVDPHARKGLLGLPGQASCLVEGPHPTTPSNIWYSQNQGSKNQAQSLLVLILHGEQGKLK